jgi:phospholipid/cholesterol/gamma-HCH transport system substrate-binding protein
VELAGVPVGQVEGFSLDQERWMAVVQMKIMKSIVLTEDVIASIKTAGLIGDKYIKLSPGVSDVPLKPGGMIIETESALDIEELISKFVFGKV